MKFKFVRKVASQGCSAVGSTPLPTLGMTSLFSVSHFGVCVHSHVLAVFSGVSPATDEAQQEAGAGLCKEEGGGGRRREEEGGGGRRREEAGGGGERPAGRSAGPLAPTAGPAGRRGVSSASERWPRPTSLPAWLRTPPTLTPEERQQKGRVVKCILSGFSETGRATVFQKVKTSFQVHLMKLKEPS